MYTLTMSVNGYQYQSEIFKIMGLSLMTPVGRFGLNVLEKGFLNDTSTFYSNLLGAMVLFCLGVIVIQIGFEIAQKGKRE